MQPFLLPLPADLSIPCNQSIRKARRIVASTQGLRIDRRHHALSSRRRLPELLQASQLQYYYTTVGLPRRKRPPGSKASKGHDAFWAGLEVVQECSCKVDCDGNSRLNPGRSVLHCCRRWYMRLCVECVRPSSNPDCTRPLF